MAKIKSSPRPNLAIGQIVYYVLPQGAARGEHRPALVVMAMESGLVNLRVFSDEGDGLPGMFYAANVAYDSRAAPGTCHLPEKE